MDLGFRETLTLLIVVIVLSALLSIVGVSWRNGISPMPSSRQVRRVVAAEAQRLAAPGLIVEAGSGWGTLGIEVAKSCKESRVVGIENSPIPLRVSQVAAWLAFGVRPKPRAARSSLSGPSVSFRRGNIYKVPYAAADLVICYLYPGAMKRLSSIFRDQLAPGASVISVCFAIPDWQPVRVITCNDLYRTKVYVYKTNS
ncbi:class I SAM-dependent methyltransferase [Cohnella cholangitidis]|uniref:Class I SAM-dependent methyltransferase n=1 Tax=Cohnella cholangitidis TaxID=2598458 RepID=A0A7G5BY84_9BACL|nr:class I SAM-dependent methyltransferase [Cohnella cholangitidis]QMV41918.1 class I SAM-dependent methyltransferase [Cohnella cholangitidis]